MTETEKKKIIDDQILKLETLFLQKYEQPFNVNNQKCFKANDTEFFIITGLSSFDAIVIEHAFSESDAKKNMFEDGDLFYMQELDENQMFKQMIAEIEEH